MARKRIEDPVTTLADWEAVNLALAEIGECERQVESVEAEMQAHMDELKLQAEMAASASQKRIAELERSIKAFVEDHAEDMDGKKTKVLNFGSTGFRKSTKITIPKAGAKLAELIRKLKQNGMKDCVVAPPEKVDRDALRKYQADEILAVGAGLKVDEVFWYEVDRKKLEPSE